MHEIDGTTWNLMPSTPMYLILSSGTRAGSARGGPPEATTVFPYAFADDHARLDKTPPLQAAAGSAP